MSKASAREIILDRISQSKDKTLGKGTFYHSKSFLHDLRYSDVMDIVLYYIGLQEDLGKISKVPTHDFSELVERVTRDWIGKVEKQWG